MGIWEGEVEDCEFLFWKVVLHLTCGLRNMSRRPACTRVLVATVGNKAKDGERVGKKKEKSSLSRPLIGSREGD